MIRRTTPPCKGCEEREPGCHGRCERYQGWVDKIHGNKEEVMKEIQKQDDLRALEVRRGRRGR